MPEVKRAASRPKRGVRELPPIATEANLMRPASATAGERRPTLLEQLRREMRLRHYSPRTEQVYMD